MSAPIRDQFDKLSLNPQMPLTRRQMQAGLSGSHEEHSTDADELPSAHSHSSRSKGKQPARRRSSSSSSNDSALSMMSRAYKTRDILSTFDAERLPNEYRSDILERILERIHRRHTPAECVIQLDLEGTIFHLAVNNDAVYKGLSEAQPVEARAVVFFDKMAKRIRKTLEAFDGYVEKGTPSPEYLPWRDPSVTNLGECLWGFVNTIQAEADARRPHGGERAAGCLIYLLREVCHRKEDAFENNTWGRRAPRGEVEDDRNLFQYLIGSASSDGPAFALDALQSLPTAVLANKGEQLEEIRELLRQHRAPKEYRSTLQAILDRLAPPITPARASQAGQKRPAPGTGRGGQKRSK